MLWLNELSKLKGQKIAETYILVLRRIFTKSTIGYYLPYKKTSIFKFSPTNWRIMKLHLVFITVLYGFFKFMSLINIALHIDKDLL
jgi:hypothetical protein